MTEGHYLRQLDDQMGRAEYDMYRAIPAEEVGMENPQHHMTYDEWRDWLAGEIAQNKYVTYIMYLRDYPIGHITIAFDEDIEDGNLSQVVRPVCRGSGLGKIMLKLAIEEARKLGVKKLVGYAREFNVASWKMMEACGFTFIEETYYGSKHYELDLEEEK